MREGERGREKDIYIERERGKSKEGKIECVLGRETKEESYNERERGEDI